jgi:hypothetical protein
MFGNVANYKIPKGDFIMPIKEGNNQLYASYQYKILI